MSMDGSKFMEMCFGLLFIPFCSPVWLDVVISWQSWLLAASWVNSWDIFIHSKSVYYTICVLAKISFRSSFCLGWRMALQFYVHHVYPNNNNTCILPLSSSEGFGWRSTSWFCCIYEYICNIMRVGWSKITFSSSLEKNCTILAEPGLAAATKRYTHYKSD